ncbi:hypothetical protein DWB84_11950 [Saccharophagus sp. K07]|jgi:hypothetical protein|uniref:hypothetical protein n=1 Tax=Saccharophagus sp. K07 TaxID=2283636 RepID=UPI001651BECA|nr:hypothetical protein [Saccharophagus sp. K07]MBC6906174.1 hypothetical protein [Saccharophagus sp. K07]
MTEQNLALIRECIARARIHEETTHHLKNYLTLLVPRLHRSIRLPQGDPVAALLQFVIRYIEYAPDFLQALHESMQRSGIEPYGGVFIRIATDFFLQPPEEIEQKGGLKELIDEAYLTHRLMEEINDRLLMLCGTPLAPMDNSLANILVYELLGEEFASKLDMAVFYAVETLFQPNNLDEQLKEFVKRHPQASQLQSLQDWPCLLSEDSDIQLSFNSLTSTKVTEH